MYTFKYCNASIILTYFLSFLPSVFRLNGEIIHSDKFITGKTRKNLLNNIITTAYTVFVCACLVCVTKYQIKWLVKHEKEKEE